jgi:transcription antitermination protein NusB
MNNLKPKMRHKAREYALQAIYQWQLTHDSPTEIELQFRRDYDLENTDIDYFIELLHQVPKYVEKIDGHMESLLDRPFHELNPVELAVLRIAVYELAYRQEIPFKVIINEALQVTKTYGAVEGFKYVNAILDGVAKKLRPLEMKRRGEPKPKDIKKSVEN